MATSFCYRQKQKYTATFCQWIVLVSDECVWLFGAFIEIM